MQRSDRVLKQVVAAFEHESHLKLHAHPVHLSFEDGALIVAGEVPDIASKKRLLQLTRMHSEGERLVDQLRVTANPPVADGELRTRICERLAQAVDFRNCVICARVKGQLELLRGTMDEAGNDGSGVIEVTVDDGVVTLTGQVISLSHKRLASVIAWWVGGCRDVVNLLELVPTEADGDDEITDVLHLVLETDPRVRAEQITINVENRTITLAGWVATEAERRQAEQDAWCLDASGGVVNHIQVRA
ncbi:BON domain-containing protein [Paraburkholderia sp. MMS20-SJTN17]|uniref:BON domain-containing protein n=1 Tax=Paraburkholderia translucens TaxID=2886945 RepID=A0ABS8KI92_9BURK|nr:BON domain-containing protein [Paraburkholderia sp. MMS20-SJTN17]MCC8404482.1 BON domain-containing protein [Paraburkholderia sp. MMS20-SJTN17]